MCKLAVVNYRDRITLFFTLISNVTISWHVFSSLKTINEHMHNKKLTSWTFQLTNLFSPLESVLLILPVVLAIFTSPVVDSCLIHCCKPTKKIRLYCSKAWPKHSIVKSSQHCFCLIVFFKLRLIWGIGHPCKYLSFLLHHAF